MSDIAECCVTLGRTNMCLINTQISMCGAALTNKHTVFLSQLHVSLITLTVADKLSPGNWLCQEEEEAYTELQQSAGCGRVTPPPAHHRHPLYGTDEDTNTTPSLFLTTVMLGGGGVIRVSNWDLFIYGASF